MVRKIKVSLAEWMINNLGEDAIEKYWSEKNEISPWDISYSYHKKAWIKCQNTDYHEDYDTVVYAFTRGNRCPYCAGKRVNPKDSFAQWGIDNVDKDFLEKYWSDKNTLSPWEISRASLKDVWIKCQKKNYHEDYKISATKFSIGKTRCPCCKGQSVVHPNDSLGMLCIDSLKLWSGKNEKSPFEYTPHSNKKVWWKCEKGVHDDYRRAINASNRYNFRCPKCVQEREESYLQEKVRLFLSEELNLPLLHEHDCSLKCINPKTNYILPYDNEVMLNKNKLLIEVHGEQHYKINSWIKLAAKKNDTTPQEELEYVQWKDKLKMEYALSQGYHYVAIPYWTDNEQEEWKSLIIHKLNEIKNNTRRN